MGRILAIDYGRKRCGIAVTDPSRIIATSLSTVASAELLSFLTEYMKKEVVDIIVIGEPKDMRNNPSESAQYIEPFIKNLRKTMPNIDIRRYDERFTSVIAHQTMLDAGLNKKRRQDKALVDSISATIILQDFMKTL